MDRKESWEILEESLSPLVNREQKGFLSKGGGSEVRKRPVFLAGATLVLVALGYVALQAYAARFPPFFNSGYGTLTVRKGDHVVLGIHFRNRTRLPFAVTAVSIDPTVFSVRNVCVIRQENGQQFTGAFSRDLPQDFAARCEPLSAIRSSWQAEYALAMAGQVMALPIGGTETLTVSYRVLGWPHAAQYRPPCHNR